MLLSLNTFLEEEKEAFDLGYYLKIHKKVTIGILLYLSGTLLLYYMGPFRWETRSPIYFIAINILYLLALWMGLFIGARTRGGYSNMSYAQENRVKRLLLPMSLLNVVITLINIYRGFGLASMNPTHLINRIVFGVNDLGAGYELAISALEGVSGADLVGGKLFTYINFFWQIFDFNIILLDLYYYKKSSSLQKLITILLIIETCVRYVAIGTNIGIFRLVVAVVVVFVIGLLRGTVVTNKTEHEKRVLKRKKSYVKYIIIFAIVVVFLFFIKTMEGRAGGNYIWEFSTYNIGGIYINKDCVFFKLFPQAFYMPIIMISAYLTQGYYGLALCLELPWKPMFGLGSSMGIVDLLTKRGIDLNSMTFQQRAEELYHWNSRVQWASMYTWLANDISFIGVIICMLVIGIFISKVLKDALLSNNPFAVCLMVYLTIMVFFIPMNNQIFQTTYMLFGFAYILFRWITTTRVKII